MEKHLIKKKNNMQMVSLLKFNDTICNTFHNCENPISYLLHKFLFALNFGQFEKKDKLHFFLTSV